MKKGFDCEKYLEEQSKHILERVNMFDNKLYLEFGGKLFDDYHAARVLPGFDLDAKVRLLAKLKDKTEIVFCINANDIEKNKIRADLGITYDLDVMRLIDQLRRMGLYVSSIVIAQYREQPAAEKFKNKMEMRGEKVYIHRPIEGYPTNINKVVSDLGYGSNPYIETTRPLVVITAPGPGSGKMATCLSQLYHEQKRNIRAGYAKFETFPVWNLPLKHPVNVAYEAATADLNDLNMIDPFHLETYGTTTVNYNRDIEIFPVVKTILERIYGGECVYKSPTDMGVNMVGNCIVDDDVCRDAAKQEIIRRYYRTWCDNMLGRVGIETAEKVEVLMNQMGISPALRSVVSPALEKSSKCNCPAMAIKLSNGEIVTGRSTGFMTAAASTLLNAIKVLSNIPDEIHLLSPNVIEPMINLKKDTLHYSNLILDLREVLIALSICAATDSTVELAVSKIKELKGCEAHATYILTQTDEDIFRKLGVNVTCESTFPSSDLFYR